MTMLSGGPAVTKYLIFLFNAIFVVIGVVLIGVGAAVKEIYQDYHHFLDDEYFSTPNLLIAVGSIIFFVSFFGCCGAIKENSFLLTIFTLLLMLIFILELSAGIAGYVLRDSAVDVLDKQLTNNMKYYNENGSLEITRVWDFIQREFHCCGVHNMSDWASKYKDQLPISCCAPQDGAYGNQTCNTSSKEVYHDGCASNFGKFISDYASVIGGAGIGVAFVELLGVFLGCKLAAALRRAGNPMLA